MATVLTQERLEHITDEMAHARIYNYPHIVKASHEELRRLLTVLWTAFPQSLEPSLSDADKSAIHEAVGEDSSV